MLELSTADAWLGQWSRRLRPEHFKLLGGEPSLHKDLAAFVRLTRRHFPATKLRLVTNGFFLDRHPELPRTVLETDTLLSISVHHDAPEYRVRIRPIEVMVRGWAREHVIRMLIWSAKGGWTRRYHGTHENMQPFEDNQPRESWAICPAKHAAQLHLGKLWK